MAMGHSLELVLHDVALVAVFVIAAFKSRTRALLVCVADITAIRKSKKREYFALVPANLSQ